MENVFTTEQLNTIQTAYQFSLLDAKFDLKNNGTWIPRDQEWFDLVGSTLAPLQAQGLIDKNFSLNHQKFALDFFGVPSSVNGRSVTLNPTIPTSYTGNDRYARYAVDRLSGDDGLKNFVSRYADPKNYLVQSQPSHNSSIWDSVFQPFGQSIVDFLNPVTGIKAITQINNSSETSNFMTNIIAPKPVNFTEELLQGSVNVVGSVGIGLGVEGVSQGIGGYVSATTPLPSGVQGPVNPGFWSTLLSGDLSGAWSMVTAPFSSAYHAPSTNSILGGTAQSTAFGQIINELVQATGKIGQAIAQVFSGNFVGAGRVFTGTPPTNTPPTTPVNLFGNYQSGGGSGGAGLGVGSGNSGQTATHPLVFPVIAVTIIVVFWLFVRKK